MGGINPFGVLVFAGYLATAILSARTGLAYARVRPAGREGDCAHARAWAWTLVAVALVTIAVTKPINLETRVTEYFRDAARAGGWYKDRRDEQRFDILLVPLAASPIVLGILLLLRHAGEAALSALATAMGLVLFIGVQTVSLHDIDAVLATGAFGFHLYHAIELGGLGLIAVLSNSRPRSSWISQSRRSPHRARGSR